MRILRGGLACRPPFVTLKERACGRRLYPFPQLPASDTLALPWGRTLITPAAEGPFHVRSQWEGGRVARRS